jgi:hypothetical protein
MFDPGATGNVFDVQGDSWILGLPVDFDESEVVVQERQRMVARAVSGK